MVNMSTFDDSIEWAKKPAKKVGSGIPVLYLIVAGIIIFLLVVFLVIFLGNDIKEIQIGSALSHMKRDATPLLSDSIENDEDMSEWDEDNSQITDDGDI